jgi:hypothetical protein
MTEKIAERQLIVHQIAFDLETARKIAEKNKTKFFAKLGVFKPKQDEIECESVQLFREPFLIAKARYFLDYYQKKTYTLKIDDDVSEVIAFGQSFTPTMVKEGILKRPYKAITFEAQERVVYKAATHMALNRTGRSIDPTQLPSGSMEPDPKKTLKAAGERVRELETSPDIILDQIRQRTAKRPSDVGKITEEAFEVSEYILLFTPIYDARCRRLKTGEIKIMPISGVTGKTLSL